MVFMWNPVKTIFQIQYEPKLCFYDRLYKHDEISCKFPHWLTDRLKVILKDYEKKHSLLIGHNSSIFESDLFDAKIEEDIISLLLSQITKFVDDNTFSRAGLRRFYLIKQEMSFDELVEILNLKIFSIEFKDIFSNPINDSSIVIVSNIGDYQFRLTLGPMRRNEIPRYIKYNIDNHLDTEPNTRVKELSKIFESYPDVSLYIDVDFFVEQKELKQTDIITFWAISKKEIDTLVENTVAMIFKEKV